MRWAVWRVDWDGKVGMEGWGPEAMACLGAGRAGEGGNGEGGGRLDVAAGKDGGAG